ncbi:exosortase [Opitutaceae bacterium EW11]|nr:exosortase [Opitutaceae bacterium EW11]
MKLPSLRPILVLNIALIGFFWLLLFNRLHTEWIVNTLYSYGWAVPFLALYLFSERWRDRPAPAADRPHPIWLVIPAVALLLYTPLRIVNEANPDWVRVNFDLTVLVAAFSAMALFAMGRFRYLWHFWFPIFFVFTALPWPVWMEENLVQTLTRWNTQFSAEALTMLGTPAMAHGNLIQIGASWVNVEEACSGIRSLQTSFMMSLFLGEFYRLNFVLRIFLMASSFVVAFALNIGRTMTLTYLSGAYGNHTLEKWHDPIGTAVMVLCLVSLWVLALGFEKLHASVLGPRKLPDPNAPAIPAAPAPFPAAFVAFGFCALVAAEVTNEAWYRYHEEKLGPPREWAIAWPTTAKSFKRGEFPDRTRAILKYNEAETASWVTPDGYGFQMYYIRWLPGRVSKFLSGAHYPTVCLPATGLQYKSEFGRYLCKTGDIEIPFTAFLFESGTQPVYVFHAILEDRPAPDGEKISYRQVEGSERIESVKRGHRNLGQRVLGISILNSTSLEEAETTLQNVLKQIVHTSQKPVAAR